jgi:UDP-4-amino-4,6-dideoxy-N-acetyl-beta-L-altrosamine transaminase
MINYGKHFIDNQDKKEVLAALKSNWLTQGPKVKIFEDNLSKYLGAKHSLVVNSGTAALHLAFISLGVKKNDLVLCSPITFLSSITSALFLEAKPSFVDIDEKTYCINLDKLEIKLRSLTKRGKKPKVIIFTDYAGQMCDWKRIKHLSQKYKFFTINDNCHSLGSRYYNDQKYAVKFADIVTHSFHPVKIITTGEGGSLSTNSTKIYKKIINLRSHGVTKNKKLDKKFGSWYYSMQDLGYNYRLPDINAALGISQLKKINKFVKKRQSIAKKYFSYLKKNENIILPYINDFCSHSFHLFPVQIIFKNLKKTKQQFFKYMLKNKIKLQVHYIPVHLQKYFKKNYLFKKGDFKESENFYEKTVSLPTFHSLKDSQIKDICLKINRFCR